MEFRKSRRGYEENVVYNQHLKLKDLKKKARRYNRDHKLVNKYLFKENIPPYPHPEFHVSHLKHDTNKAGLRGISEDGGFKNPFKGNLLWWSLVVGPDEIRSAERRILETTYPDRMEEQAQGQQSFLEKFATSPAFNKTSRLGSYRFTFHLEELLTAYSQQFCEGKKPIMRVLETVLYSQKVMYAVVVHSPDNQEEFSNCPFLPDDDPNAVCTYNKDGCFIWRAEAMCGTHKYKLKPRRAEKRMEAEPTRTPYPEFYVWDHVAVALHVDDEFCQGAPPVMRVLRTILYKKEVMYVVVVHSPANQEFSDRPLLTDDDPNAVCTYKDGRFIWRAEVMCGTHSYQLVQIPEEKQMEAQPVESRSEYYVWDNVAVALHVENQVLNFDPIRLRENLKFCSEQSRGKINTAPYDDLQQAEENVEKLWPDYPAPLEEDE